MTLGLAWIIGADPVDGEDRRRIAGGAFDEPVAGDALAHQAARIFLLRLLQDLPGVAELDDLAALEHHDAIGDLRDDREVVGYVQRRRAVLANEFAKRGEALDLRRHVERGGRLVEDQNVGLGDHRHRRHHALQLPAGDLMGIARADRLRARQIELPEKVDRLGARRLRRQHAVADRGFAHLLHQRVRRIERGGGALRDIGDLGPAQRAPLVGADRADVLVAEDDGAANDIAVAAGVAHRGQADRRLAGADSPIRPITSPRFRVSEMSSTSTGPSAASVRTATRIERMSRTTESSRERDWSCTRWLMRLLPGLSNGSPASNRRRN